jgi:hypothetical protein
MATTKKPLPPKAANRMAKPVAQKAVAKPAVKAVGKAKPEAAPAAKKGFPAKKAFPARKPGAKAPARKPLPTFKAPADFKPHFLLAQFVTDKDGLIGSTFKATRYTGRFDREVDDKKKFDLGAYDSKTLLGMATRFAAVTYRANAEKKFPVSPKERAALKGAHRLPAATQFQVLLRIGKKAADQSLTAGVKTIWQVVQNAKTGRQGLAELEKTDPAYRAIRKASRILPAAFKEVQMPPKRGRAAVQEE